MAGASVSTASGFVAVSVAKVVISRGAEPFPRGGVGTTGHFLKKLSFCKSCPCSICRNRSSDRLLPARECFELLPGWWPTSPRFGMVWGMLCCSCRGLSQPVEWPAALATGSARWSSTWAEGGHPLVASQAAQFCYARINARRLSQWKQGYQGP
jgi:hypothetical protein